MSMSAFSRRAFLRAVGRGAATVAAAAANPGLVRAAPQPSDPRPSTERRDGTGGRPTGHPEPRPDVDGSAVLDGSAVPPHLSDLFDGIRRIPQVVDGIRCTCGCADLPGMYSLLSCYEGAGMAQYCTICQGEGRLALRLHGEGRTLDEIRAVVDRRFG